MSASDNAQIMSVTALVFSYNVRSNDDRILSLWKLVDNYPNHI